MAIFVSTIKFKQGLGESGDASEGAASLQAATKKMGIKFRYGFWTMAADAVLLLEAPDFTHASDLMAHLNSLGTVEESSLGWYSANETEEVLAKMASGATSLDS